MGTRAIYTFIDDFTTYHVYKSLDNYPSGAVEFISNALNNAWELPRFEADEFAAAFISENKKSPGGICIAPCNDFDHGFRYEIACKEGQLYIKAFIAADEDCFFEGFLDEFKKSSYTCDYKAQKELSFKNLKIIP